MNLSKLSIGTAAVSLFLIPTSGVMALGTGLPAAMGVSAGVVLVVAAAASLVLRSLQATFSEPFESTPE